MAVRPGGCGFIGGRVALCPGQRTFVPVGIRSDQDKARQLTGEGRKWLFRLVGALNPSPISISCLAPRTKPKISLPTEYVRATSLSILGPPFESIASPPPITPSEDRKPEFPRSELPDFPALCSNKESRHSIAIRLCVIFWGFLAWIR